MWYGNYYIEREGKKYAVKEFICGNFETLITGTWAECFGYLKKKGVC